MTILGVMKIEPKNAVRHILTEGVPLIFFYFNRYFYSKYKKYKLL
jgi:hypothetical protein